MFKMAYSNTTFAKRTTLSLRDVVKAYREADALTGGTGIPAFRV
jgi:hypothetical protein